MMIRRGVTLVEVLVAIFVMAIGMLALLTMFPIGAISMSQALKDDRYAAASITAGAIANGLDVRNDENVKPTLDSGKPVYVDPMWTNTKLTTSKLGGVVERANLNNGATLSNFPYRFFTLIDDLTFDLDGKPVNAGTANLERAAKYSWAFFLKPASVSPPQVHYWVVVYYGRSTTVEEGETLCDGTPQGEPPTTTQLALTVSPASTSPPPARRGTWLCDINDVHGQTFYRVVNSVVSGNTATVEVDPPLNSNLPAQFVLMENVGEIFFRGLLR